MRKKPLIIGLTGGIGSGKTTAALLFQKLGVPIYIADDRARELTGSDPKIHEKIREKWGNGLFDEKGQLQRKKLGEIVFNNEKALAELNAIVHPRVAADFSEWLSKQDSSYVLKEAAILFESGTYRECDQIILVVAPKETRIKRVQKRSGLSREAIEQRMNHQWSDDNKIALSDYIIQNDGSQLLLPQIYEIHEDIKRLSNS